MKTSAKIFENLFSDSSVTPSRLLSFGRFVTVALNRSNKEGQYTAIIALLTTALNALEQEISDVDTSLNGQVNGTKNVELLMVSFFHFMRDNEPFIAKALGGRNTDGYLSFYPHKITEYRVNKTTMPTLSNRVQKLAVIYKEQLGEELANPLLAFSSDYSKVLTTQQDQMKTVNEDRNERTNYFVQTQWALTAAVHTVATVNSSNTAASASIFPFEMLLPPTKHKNITLEGSLASKGLAELINRSLSTRVKITIRNKGLNSDIAVWLAATPTEAMPATAKIVKANSRLLASSDKLGSLKNTFLMVQNLSDINAATYSVEISGLKKTKEDDVRIMKIKTA